MLNQDQFKAMNFSVVITRMILLHVEYLSMSQMNTNVFFSMKISLPVQLISGLYIERNFQNKCLQK